MANENRLKENVAAHLRLPLHRAPFYFAPHYLATPETWGECFIERVKYILEQNPNIRAEVGVFESYVLRVRFQQLELFVDAKTCGFSVWKTNGAHIDGDGRFFMSSVPVAMARPNDFFRQIKNAENIPEYILDELSEAVVPVAGHLHHLMNKSFREAVNEGHALVEVKYNSIGSPFSMVSWSELEYLQYEIQEEYFPDDYCDDKLGNGRTALGDNFFSLSVVPTSHGDSLPDGIGNHSGAARVCENDIKLKTKPKDRWGFLMSETLKYVERKNKEYGAGLQDGHVIDTNPTIRWNLENLIKWVQALSKKTFKREEKYSEVRRKLLELLEPKGLYKAKKRPRKEKS
jgi:hypothetical protein